jgi:hypothetical protein
LSHAQALLPYALILAAASFIYIAIADLLPMLRREVAGRRSCGRPARCLLVWRPLRCSLCRMAADVQSHRETPLIGDDARPIAIGPQGGSVKAQAIVVPPRSPDTVSHTLMGLMTRERWIEVARIVVTGLVALLYWRCAVPIEVLWAAVAVGLYPLVKTGVLDLVHEHKVGTEIFVTIATLVAVFGGETVAGAVLMVIILIAEFIAELNTDRARASIKALIGRREERAGRHVADRRRRARSSRREDSGRWPRSGWPGVGERGDDHRRERSEGQGGGRSGLRRHAGRVGRSTSAPRGWAPTPRSPASSRWSRVPSRNKRRCRNSPTRSRPG